MSVNECINLLVIDLLDKRWRSISCSMSEVSCHYYCLAHAAVLGSTQGSAAAAAAAASAELQVLALAARWYPPSSRQIGARVPKEVPGRTARTWPDDFAS